MIERRVNAGGVTLAAVEDGASDRPTIILVHGYPDTKEVWSGVIPRLAEHFHVIAYDVRGFGGSSAPRGPAAYGIERLADDLDAVTRLDGEPRSFHLVGHDWGGIAGWELAAMERFNGRVRSFTTIAGPSLPQVRQVLQRLLRHGRVGEAARRLYRSWYVIVLCAPGGPTLSWRVVLAGGRWAKQLRRREGLSPGDYAERPSLVADGLHGANLYRRNILLRLAGRADPADVGVPVQLIVPARDRFISDGYYELAAKHSARLVRRTIDATHWVPLSHPEPIAAWIAAFVEEVERG